jgi:peptide/nickel transport system substrate-binding protein
MSPDRSRGWRLAATAALTITALAIALAGCTALPGTALGTGDLRDTSEPPAGRLSSLVWALPQGEPSTLDYAKAGDYSPYLVVSNLCDNLLRLNPDESQSPALARSWSQPDPLTLVLNLRTDVQFWDGTGLTSADVVYSLNRQRDPNAVASGFFANVKNIEATDAHTVTVRFSQPDELFLKELATTAGAVVEQRYAEHAGAAFGTATGGVMCSGPFELTAWESGGNIELTANPHYWDPKYRAKADKVTLVFVTDTTALTQALASGAIDGAFEVPTGALLTLKSSTSGRLYYGPGLQTLSIYPTTSTGPAAIPDIRRALSLVIDREQLAKVVYRGTASPSTAVLPRTSWDPAAEDVYAKAVAELPHVATTPTAASLAEAQGLVSRHRPDLRPMVLGIPAGAQDQTDTAAVVAAAAAKIGLEVTVRQIPPLQFSSLYYDASYRIGIDLALTSGFLDIPDPLDWIPNLATAAGIFNWSGYRDAVVDANLSQAQQTLEPRARALLVTDAQRRWEAATIAVPLLSLNEVTYLNKRITGATTSFAYLFAPSLATIGTR